MNGQMKTLIDRMNAMYSPDYKFRDIYNSRLRRMVNWKSQSGSKPD